MHFQFKYICSAFLALTLVACGGGSGGGGGGGGGGNNEGAYLTLKAAPNVTTFEGESVSFVVSGESSKSFAKLPRIAIIETTGAITQDVAIWPSSSLAYDVSLNTSTTLPAGEQTIKLTVRMCEDDPLVCSKPFPGSPWVLNQKVTVKSKTEGAKRLTVTPATFELSIDEGDSADLEISAVGTGFSSGFYRGVDAPRNIFSPDVNILNVNSATGPAFTIKLKTLASLPPGTYTTAVQVRLCADDDIVVCARPLSGSPWLVPVKLTVKPGTNLKPVATLAQLGAWSTYQGNASHNAYVAANFDPNNFSRRWTVPIAEVAVPTTSLAVDNGRIFHVHRPATDRVELQAIREDNGQIEWTVNLGNLNQVNAPAAANGRVYLTSTGHADSFFWVFDQATGLQLGTKSMSSQWAVYHAPTVFDGTVYTGSGYYGGMKGFDAITYLEQGSYPLPQDDGWTPAVDANHAYVFMNKRLFALSVKGGGPYFEVASPDIGSFSAATPTLSDKQMAYVVTGGHLLAFDLAKRERAWTAPEVVGRAVYANDVVYTLHRIGAYSDGTTVLEARSADKGALLWTSEPLLGTRKEGYFEHLLITGNLAFVSSGWSTIALDLVTRKVVWRNTLGGEMSVSNRGILYIHNRSITGSLGAVNLQ